MTGFKRVLAACALIATAPLAGERTMQLTPEWEYVADTVMGGVSTGQLNQEIVAGREAARLTGEVSLENNGGFIQMASDLADGAVVDVSGWTGIEVDVIGNGASYEVRLRTDQLSRPWQSFRVKFDTTAEWQTIQLPWSTFEGSQTDKTFDPARLRRMGVLAVGSQMDADVAVSSVRLYR